MNSTQDSSLNDLNRQITALEEQQFTGELDIKSNDNIQFKFYFCLGRVIWVDGGIHPYRSWRRLIVKYCCDIELDREHVAEAELFKCWNYRLLTILLEIKEIDGDTFADFIQVKVDEVIFDLIQLSQTQLLNFTTHPSSGEDLLKSGLKVSLTLIPIKQAFDRTLQTWLQWCDRNLENISPNLAPTVQDKERLALEVSAKTYEVLLKFVDGHHTLRDLAIVLKKDVLSLTVSLIPYLDNGLFQLQETEDISKSSVTITPNSEVQKTAFKDSFLNITVACIDDSSQALGIMAEILHRAGFSFVGIQDPQNAIAKLLLSSPDIIFLDIGMPYLNGYEVCAQLRRVPELDKIPIVILTGQDGMVDRVRAKMAGASGFVAKPIKAVRILDNVMKFVAIY